LKAKTKSSLVDDWFLVSQLEGKDPKTIERYKNIVLPFFDLVQKDPLEVAAADIRRYFGHLAERSYSRVTISIAYKNLHVFFEFLRKEGHRADNPLKLVSKPKVPQIFPKIITEDEARALLAAAKRHNDKFIKRRNFAMLCLLFDSGLRASELTGLKLTDVSLENQVVKVYGKGAKERIVPFSPDTGKALINYLKVRGRLPFEESFFVTRNADRLDRHRLYKIIKELAVLTGVDPKRVSPHVLRHTFATTWIRAGGDGKKLQQMMGHADGRVVDCYIHLTGIDLKEAHNRYSPLRRLNNH